MAYTLYGLSPIVVNSTTLPVENIALPQDVLAVVHQHSGNEYPTLVASPGANPRLTFRTPFKAAFDLFGFTCVSVTTLNVYLATFAALIRSASSVHAKLPLASSATAYGHITGFSVNQDGILMAECECVYLSSNGTTHPIAATTVNNALPTLSSQPTLHTHGPISIGGTVIGGLQSVGVDLAQQYTVRRSDGDAYPRVAARTGGAPKLTGEHEDPIALQTAITTVGSSAAIIQYFRSFNATTGIVDTANSVSITLATPDRIQLTTLPAAEQGQPATAGFEAWGLSSTSTHPFVVSTAATTPAVP